MSASKPSSPVLPVAEAADIDAAVRLPVLVLLAFAILWLLTASALGLVAAIKLTRPDFLASCEWLTFGRVYPAALNALAYGWGVSAGLAVALWLMARLSRAVLPGGGLLVVAAVCWNVGVKLGILGILAGWSNSVPWLEMPRQVMPFLLVAYVCMAAWVVGALRAGSSPRLYVSQWWVLAALFWLPWLLTAAGAMLFFAPVRGTVQSVVAAWYAHGLLALWFAPLGLGLVYYLLPKLLGKPIRAYYLAPFGFWFYALFSAWAGAARLADGPVPAWTQAAGAIASFMLLLPVAVIAVNLFGSFLGGGLAALGRGVVLRFAAVAALFFVLSTLLYVAMALPGVAAITRLTWFAAASDYAVIYGVFSFAVFGAVYYLAPRLVGREWPFASLIRAHFWLALAGLVLAGVSLSLGGLQQGRELTNAKIPFADVTQHTLPYLQAATLAGALLLLGHLAFAVNFVKLVLCPRHRAASAAAPVPASLLAAPELELEVHAS